MTVDRRQALAIAAAGLGAPLFSSGARAQMPRRGGTLVVAGDTEPRNLNPGMIASNGVFYVASKVIEPLAEMAYGGDGLTPRLALSWEGSADGRSATFRLRPGVTWHDGRPFTSADVAFSALSIWKPLQNLGRVVFRDLAAVETPDPLTAVFRFSEPTPFQLIRNALPALTAVLPRHLYEGTDIAANPANTRLVGTGPFRFVEHRPGEFYRLERNPTYWEPERPLLDQIVYRMLPDRAAIAAALEADQIRLAAFSAVPLSDLERIGRVPGVRVIREGYEGITYSLTVEINHRRRELADPRVRRAIAHAIDRRFVLDAIFLGTAVESTGPIPRFDRQFHTADVETTPFDRRRAEALLDEAGFRGGPAACAFPCGSCPRRGSSRPASSATICARRCARSGSTRRSSPTTRPATPARSTRRTSSISRSARRSTAWTRRSPRRSCIARACRPACRSRTSTAMRARRWTGSSKRPRAPSTRASASGSTATSSGSRRGTCR